MHFKTDSQRLKVRPSIFRAINITSINVCVFLSYLHINGFIHRDVKAANLLIDDDGTVLLGDLGVAADLAEDNSHIPTTEKLCSTTSAPSLSNFSPTTKSEGSSVKRAVAFNEASPDVLRPRIGKRKSFVGTVC